MKKLSILLAFWIYFPVLIADADIISPKEIQGAPLGSGPLKAVEVKKRNYDAFLSAVSPDYKLNTNILSLTQVPYQTRNRSIMFIFYMNHKKEKSDTPPLHIMLPLKKNMGIKQQVVEDQYPIDFSIASYRDGYASDEWNMVLPRKKPREIDIGLLWSF